MAHLVHLSDDVYETLKKMKGRESYSVAIRKLINKETNKNKVLSFFGRGGIDKEKIKELSGGWKKWSDEYA